MIGRICNREVVLADKNETVECAAQRMLKHKVGTLLVLNDRQQPIGILTDRDLVTRVMATGKAPDKTLVGEAMTPNPRTVSDDTPIESVLAMMRSGGFRRMPVVGDFERLVGIISLDDVLNLLSEEFTKIGEMLNTASHQLP